MLSGACTRTTLPLSRARASRCAFPTPNKVHHSLVFDKKSCNTMGNRESKLRAHGQKRATPTTAGVGEWESPITSAFITEKAVRLGAVAVRPHDGAVTWLEGRPEEGGRQVLVIRTGDGEVHDVTPGVDTGFNVRTTVHEYGGGDYTLAGSTVYFTNFKDQALYSQDVSNPKAPGAPVLVTPGSEARGERFADTCIWELPTPAAPTAVAEGGGAAGSAAGAAAEAKPAAAATGPGRRLLVAVSEVHRDQTSGAELGPDQVVNRVVAVDVSTGAVTQLAGGADFYMSPRVSPCGTWLAWVQWNHPNMPWDHTSLMVAPLRPDGTAGEPVRVRGGASAVQQPVWSPDGAYLYFVDDAAAPGADAAKADPADPSTGGWWNLYRCRVPDTAAGGGGGWAAAAAAAEALHPAAAEFGFPSWTLGRKTFQVLPDGSVLALYGDPSAAGTALALLQPPAADATAKAWKLTRLDSGLTSFGSGPAVRVAPDAGGGGRVTVGAIASAADRQSAVVSLTVGSAGALAKSRPGDWKSLKASSSSKIPDGYLSVPEAVAYPTHFDGQPATAHMLYYPPVNKDFAYPAGTLPPLLVKSHGGPTSAAASGLSPLIQYWTSRGFAVADVDYGGSTGYGTAYRNRLQGRWGLVDVQDCAAAAEWAVSAGRVDKARLTISGGSAGGFTTLACLAFRKTFSAGVSLYGVADLKLLAEHTHKFESRYLDGLLGPLPAAEAVYAARSPLAHAGDFSAPVAFFQGDQDKVVPPEQAVVMHKALKDRGLPTALVMLAGEQHGFRLAVSIRTSLDGELFFYGAVLGFPASMPPDLPDIPIDNLPKKQEQQQKPEQPKQEQQKQEEGKAGAAAPAAVKAGLGGATK